MRRTIAGVLLALTVAALLGVAAPASAATALTVRVMKGQTTLIDDGTVDVVLRARCSPPLGTFEVDVSVRRGSTFGSSSIVQSGVVPCDRRWHRMIVNVAAETGGPFTSGFATVDVFLGANEGGGADVSAEVSTGLKL